MPARENKCHYWVEWKQNERAERAERATSAFIYFFSCIFKGTTFKWTVLECEEKINCKIIESNCYMKRSIDLTIRHLKCIVVVLPVYCIYYRSAIANFCTFKWSVSFFHIFINLKWVDRGRDEMWMSVWKRATWWQRALEDERSNNKNVFKRRIKLNRFIKSNRMTLRDMCVSYCPLYVSCVIPRTDLSSW